VLQDHDTEYQLAHAELFAERLRVLLRRRFGGGLPKAARVARAFSDECPGRSSGVVAPETVRRWMRGLSLPDLQRFGGLCRFLRLTPTEVCYLALIHHGEALSAPAPQVQGAPAIAFDVRAALHALIDSADREALTAAYLASLAATHLHQNGAGGGGCKTGSVS